MKCEEAQSHFSDYLEKTADGPRTKGIENHLTGCPICREEFSGLVQCRELIASLPEVEPPLGFTTRIMAHVAETAKTTGFWTRLFVPVKIKLPLEATAVVLVGALSLYLYQNQDANNLTVPSLPQQPLAITPKTAGSPIGAAQTATIQGREAKSRQQGSNKDKPTIKAKPTTSSNTLASASDSSPRGSAETPRSFPIPVQGIVAGAGMGGDIPMPHQRNFRLFPELPNLGEPVPDYEIYVRVGARQSRDVDAAANSAQVSASNSSDSMRAQNLQPPPPLNILWYTVPQEQYEQFKSELATQATIESEIPVAIKDREWSFRSDGPLYIKVTVLGANPP